MAVYQFGFYGFSELNVVNAAGQSGVQLTTNTTQGIGTPGERFRLQDSTPTVTTIRVDDDDTFATDGSVNEAGLRARIAASSAFGTAGQVVDLEYRITILTNEVPPRELTFYTLSVGGQNVGIVGTEPLNPGLQYTITRASDQETPTTLRNYGLNGRIVPDVPGENVLNWDVIFCFTFGTLIDTPDGGRLIDDLCPGDLVTTLHNGSQVLRWVGSRHINRGEMEANPSLRPILFDVGAMGNARPLLVSQQHRMLLDDWRAQVYFGEDSVLIAAKGLENGTTIRQVIPKDGVTYCHLLFDRHEVLVAEGALSESFHPGESGMDALDEAQRREIEALFPHMPLDRRRAAFPIVRNAEARALRLDG